jgi:hypothetical protein
MARKKGPSSNLPIPIEKFNQQTTERERRKTMDKKEEYQKRVEAQLKEWKTKIEMLEARGAKFTAETKAELLKDIGELRQKRTLVNEKWNALQSVSGESWDTMKDGVERAAAELKSAMERVKSRFK